MRVRRESRAGATWAELPKWQHAEQELAWFFVLEFSVSSMLAYLLEDSSGPQRPSSSKRAWPAAEAENLQSPLQSYIAKTTLCKNTHTAILWFCFT